MKEFIGKAYIYKISNDDILTIETKKGKKKIQAHINEFELLYFKEAGLFSLGELVIDHDNLKFWPNIDRFKKSDNSIYKELFDYLKERCDYLELTLIQARAYKGITSLGISKNKKKRKALSDKNRDKSIKAKLKSEKYRMIKEYKCVCTRCSNIFYYDEIDEKFAANQKLYTLGSIMRSNTSDAMKVSGQIKNIGQCPQCGSKAVTKEELSYIVDENNNLVEDKFTS